LQAAKDRTAITVRWAAHDDNGDELTYSLYLRGDGETIWRLLKDNLRDKAYSFDATLIPDGGYQIKVVASDAPSHTPGDALTGDKISERFEVDTTPPVVSALHATGEHVDCEGSHCPGRSAWFLTLKMPSRPLPAPSTRSTPVPGSTLSRWAASPTRSANTMTFSFPCQQRPR
jgi:hypothetical protein